VVGETKRLRVLMVSFSFDFDVSCERAISEFTSDRQSNSKAVYVTKFRLFAELRCPIWRIFILSSLIHCFVKIDARLIFIR